jgi:hypothetical protein
VIGTDEMLNITGTVTDSIGYAFWGSFDFAGKNNIKYLSIDGVDPLFDSYTDGTIPRAGNGLLPQVTMSHVIDGSYPLWSMLRFVTNSAAAKAAAQTLSAAAQSMVSFGPGATQPNFVPYSQVKVLRAHHDVSFIEFNQTNVASNGPDVCGPNAPPESGGDAGGMVFSLQAGADYCVLTGTYNTSQGIGPTSQAAFGVRQ